jgi:DNA-binding phage protein
MADLDLLLYLDARGRAPFEGWFRELDAQDLSPMPLTRSFNDLVKSRVEADPAFRQALFREAVQTMLDGDVATAKSVLRDYINATVGFERLALTTGTPAKSLMRMFGRQGNPTAENLLGVISALQQQTGVRLEVAAVADAA